MTKQPVADTRRITRLWYAVLISFASLLVVFNAYFAHRVFALRASDYRVDIAEAKRHIEAGNFVAAMAAVDEATRKAPRNPEPLVMRGLIQFRLCNWDQAITVYTQAVLLGSNDSDARVNTVWSYVELGRYHEAIKLGRESLAAGIDSYVLYRYIAEACVRAEQYAEAVPYLLRALEGQPNDLYVIGRLRQAYQATGDTDAAARLKLREEQVQGALSRIAPPAT